MKLALTTTDPPLGVNLIALLRKLRMTWATLKRSQSTASSRVRGRARATASAAPLSLVTGLMDGVLSAGSMTRSTSLDRACGGVGGWVS